MSEKKRRWGQPCPAQGSPNLGGGPEWRGDMDEWMNGWMTMWMNEPMDEVKVAVG